MVTNRGRSTSHRSCTCRKRQEIIKFEVQSCSNYFLKLFSADFLTELLKKHETIVLIVRRYLVRECQFDYLFTLLNY
jgi:hypothetical protein